jgi:uncharacterized protein
MTTQTLTQPTHVARDFFKRFDANDIDGVLDLLADDATYWIAGRPGEMPGAGPLSKQQIAKVFRRMTERLDGGLRMTVKNTVTEGDQVALEVESYGKLLNGRIYNNQYHLLMRIRGDKIAAVKEYYDSLHVWNTWYRPD